MLSLKINFCLFIKIKAKRNVRSSWLLTLKNYFQHIFLKSILGQHRISTQYYAYSPINFPDKVKVHTEPKPKEIFSLRKKILFYSKI